MKSLTVPRVLQVVLSLTPGGTERLVVELVRRSVPEIAMAVCCLDDVGAWGEELRQQKIKVDALNRAAGFHPQLGYRIAQAVKRHEANVIHCHQYSPFVYSCLARFFAPGVRVVFTEHGRLSDAPPSRKRRIANQVLAAFPFETFAVSGDLKSHIVAEGFSAARVGIICNGIDVGKQPDAASRRSARRTLGLADSTFVIGTVARLDTVKDLGTLIHAVRTVCAQRVTTLLVVGSGEERSRLETAAHDLILDGSVRFLGHRNDARELLAALDVYANSSISEGISLTILEAMAAALPVVATRVGGTPEILDESCGRLVPARDTAQLAAALLELSAREDLRHQLGQAGRRRVEERFTLERMIHEYQQVYYRAVA